MAVSPVLASVDTLWLGVHKTGTTFLQKSLDLSQRALRAAGVQYMELAAFRAAYTRPLLHQGHPDPVGPPLPAGKRLVFDENIPALVQHALGAGGLYPDIGPRARRVADHLGLVRPRVVLGLRGFGGFLPSLYCEALKSTAFVPFRRFLVTRVADLSWDDLVGRVVAAFPGSEVMIYTAEALRGRERALLGLVTGVEAAAFTLLDGAERPGFSNAAVQALHEVAKSRAVTRADVSGQTRLHPKGPGVPGFDPWTMAEAATLDRIYADDLARLVRRPQVRFVDQDLQGQPLQGQVVQGGAQAV